MSRETSVRHSNSDQILANFLAVTFKVLTGKSTESERAKALVGKGFDDEYQDKVEELTGRTTAWFAAEEELDSDEDITPPVNTPDTATQANVARSSEPPPSDAMDVDEDSPRHKSASTAKPTPTPKHSSLLTAVKNRPSPEQLENCVCLPMISIVSQYLT